MNKDNNKATEERKNQIISHIKEFCDQKLNEEYLMLSIKMLDNIVWEEDVSFMKGKPQIWAAAIIHALGTVNFLFDKSFEPYVTTDEINEFFGTVKSTTGNKSKLIRDLLNIGMFDSEFSTKHIAQNNPLNRMRMVDGFIVMDTPEKSSVSQTPEKPNPAPKKTSKKSNASSIDMDLFAGMDL